MKGAIDINYYFCGSKTLFIIPLYQRKYAWQQKHCIRLFEDLKKIHNNNLPGHFFGCIVSTKANEIEDDLLIIDGQQRITTISILILAALNAVANGDMEPGTEAVDVVKNDYLYATRKKIDRQIKLRPIEGDLEAYDALFTNNPKNFIKNSGMTSNYELFYKLIQASNLTFQDLINAIDKLEIIDIRLESKDNPQLIFESLNSCGKDLEESDKVRNYLLMSLSGKEQDEYYYKYWRKIEIYTNDEPTMFIRDYLTVKNGSLSNIEDLYFDFKQYDANSQMGKVDLFEDLLKFAKFYHQIIKGDTENAQINRKLKQIANIGSIVHIPYFLAFFDYATTHNLDISERYEVLDTIENYWARRIICNIPANVLQKTFATLHNDILKIYKLHYKRGEELTLPYSQILKYILLRKQGTSAFPKDNDVKTYFPTRQIYRISNNYKLFLFERLENENSPEANDTISEKIKEGKITIEHIMPQTLTPQWKEALGDDWQQIYDTYLHTFANLTLTGYNSSYSNHSFQEKKDGYIDNKGNKINGFKDSAFCLSNYLKRCTQWTLKEIKEREQILLKNFLHLWPMIETQYIPLEKEYELISLDEEDYDIRWRKIIGYNYRNQFYPVSNWLDMLIQVCKLVFRENPSKMTYIASTCKTSWFRTSEAKDYSKIADHCYVYSSCSSNTKRTILSYLFQNCEIPTNLLEFALLPLTDKEIEVEDNY